MNGWTFFAGSTARLLQCRCQLLLRCSLLQLTGRKLWIAHVYCTWVYLLLIDSSSLQRGHGGSGLAVKHRRSRRDMRRGPELLLEQGSCVFTLPFSILFALVLVVEQLTQWTWEYLLSQSASVTLCKPRMKFTVPFHLYHVQGYWIWILLL